MNNMYILLILFFTSLGGIVFMIGRKLATLQNGQINEGLGGEKVLFEVPYFQEIRQVTIENIKKYGHATLVITLRFYIRSNNFIKNKYEEIKIKSKNKFNKKKNQGGGMAEGYESSKFLKMISDYKRKIREIKHRIKEEENL